MIKNTYACSWFLEVLNICIVKHRRKPHRSQPNPPGEVTDVWLSTWRRMVKLTACKRLAFGCGLVGVANERIQLENVGITLSPCM